MFKTIDITRLASIPGVQYSTSLTVETIPNAFTDIWVFASDEQLATYQAAAGHPDPLLHTMIMLGSIEFRYADQWIRASLASPAPAIASNRPIPDTSDALAEAEYRMEHIVNHRHALTKVTSSLHEPKASMRLRPSGKKRKPSSTVSQPGSIYNVSWVFNDPRCLRKEPIGINSAKQMTCCNRPLPTLKAVAEQYSIPSVEAGEHPSGYGHHDVARACDQCDKLHVIRTNIKLTIKTMPLFPELQATCDILGI